MWSCSICPGFKKPSLHTTFLLCVFLMVNIALSINFRAYEYRWLNIPIPPKTEGGLLFSLGDQQFAYAGWGLALQNMGDSSGQSIALSAYDYKNLSRWFFFVDHFDPQGRFVPYLAAYYFGAVTDVQKLSGVIDYLEVVGQRKGHNNWRWLVQAIYLARFKMEDLDRALDLAHILAGLEETDRPAWTYQMPAFIYRAQGKKEEALAIMLEMLKTSAQDMAPEEIFSTREYICNQLYTPSERSKTPLCEGIEEYVGGE